MSHQPYDSRSVLRALTGLDFGLRVRVEPAVPQQRSIFPGPEGPSVCKLTSELAQNVSRLRVLSYGLRAQLKDVTYPSRPTSPRAPSMTVDQIEKLAAGRHVEAR
jgi:hypothetical protein